LPSEKSKIIRGKAVSDQCGPVRLGSSMGRPSPRGPGRTMSPELTVAVDAALLPGWTKSSWRYCNIPMIYFVLYKANLTRGHVRAVNLSGHRLSSPCIRAKSDWKSHDVGISTEYEWYVCYVQNNKSRN
jgi:hypothetical protein